MSKVDRQRFRFPKIERIKLNAFSLYQLQPNISLELKPGATCIVGANGIGKSTLLSAINFALTGNVPDPSRRFLRVQDYIKLSSQFTNGFFDGRINELDRESASIFVEFSINDKNYSIQRNFFTQSELSYFSIEKSGTIFFDSSEMSSSKRNEEYELNLCRDIGLHSFEQFIFLQHFLFTFDESRHLLFWDSSASPSMLHICFGVSPQDAEQADEIYRQMEQAGSLARNHQFAATNLSKQIKSLQNSIIPSGYTFNEIEKSQAEYNNLKSTLSDAVSNLEDVESRINQLDAKSAQATSSMIAYKAEYAELFDSYINSKLDIGQHPIIYNLLHDKVCPICREQGEKILSYASECIEKNICPLCKSKTDGRNSNEENIQSKLSEIDKKINEARISLESTNQEKYRKDTEYNICLSTVNTLNSRLKEFEKNNERILDSIKHLSSQTNLQLQQQIDSLKSAQASFIKERDDEYRKRDAKKEELTLLQKQLEKKYAEAEVDFVPLFQSLAEKFLGIKLDISLVATSPKNIKLELSMRGDARNKSSQLSESQRFFVDIALRMALAQHISHPDNPATLLIDTPEGSLDIAYENCAGEMFASFVENGHDLIMTANINTSQLLLALAERCGDELMSMVKMTEWTILSDIQQQSTHLFEKSYKEIQERLALKKMGA